ncbi:MAG TPA: SusC/RagA family TonB-linked outer membrane protein [Bacteroidales bacterium]|nr:SusC/RagA family TonB-linked outer membrane protein [Bacteroidales bacterium]
MNLFKVNPRVHVKLTLASKTLRVMRLVITLLILGISEVLAENTYSQNTRLTLESKNQTVRDVLRQIENQSEFFFLYNSKIVDVDRLVDIQVENVKIGEVLDKLFAGTDVKHQAFDRQIVLSPINISPNIEVHQEKRISGKVTDQSGSPIAGASVFIKGTTTGTVTDGNGNFSLLLPEGTMTLTFSFIGMTSKDVEIGNQTVFNVILEETAIGLDEVIVVGYGTQKRSDITGTVASMPRERLEMAPNLNVAQAIQGAIPGVIIQTSSAGAAPDEVIMIRGRNSILASNEPLIVVDGIPYGGEIRDINPNDVKSIEILKDASASAIYGSRGANGVILITSKEGSAGAPVISYDARMSLMRFTNLPDLMNGEEFYNFKKERQPNMITTSEQQIYDSGKWVDWFDLATRNGFSHEHNLSLSGGFERTNYYVAGSLLDVKGVMIKDDYKRITSRFNIDTKVNSWLTIGTRTQLSFDDASGQSPDSGPTRMNPLSTAYDNNGNLTIYPWPEDPYFANPLEPILWSDVDKAYQVMSNNYGIINFPFIKGLSYRLNSGVRIRFRDEATYRATDGKTGYEANGRSNTDRTLWNNVVIENILSYNKEIGKHNIFATALYSFEENASTRNGETASRFPHDFLLWYSAGQAEVSLPSYSFNRSVLISQMIRLNYSYDSRYLLTITGRRDGFSGFGAKSKWGIFPSVALGWNLANENFFPLKNLFNELKMRVSYGLNGNQAVGAYETITRLRSADWVSSQTVVPGYIPNNIGMDDLGWESSGTLNFGLDFGILQNRITGDLNIYKTTTTDLLLNRTISAVHGITSVTQNIGKTGNSGIELTINSRNIVKPGFTWAMSGNMALIENKIISLYGFLNEAGKEVDDVSNKWFIGHPIRVNYDYVIDGVWHLDEAEEAAKWGSQPGYIKLRDVNGDYELTAEDRQIAGQQDPKFVWGLTNSFSVKKLKLDVFLHGVHGVTKANGYMLDDVYEGVRRNTTNKDRWTPDNPSNEFCMNNVHAGRMAGIDIVEIGNYFKDASFIRIKDISLSYDFSKGLVNKAGINKLRIFFTGRNWFTFTKWYGMDPELEDQRSYPLQKEFVFGLNLGF